MNRALSIQHEQTEGRHRLLARGELDLAGGPALHAAVDEIASTGALELEIDLSQVRFLDGAGIGAVAHAVARCEARGIPVKLVRPAARSPRRILQVTGMDRELPWWEPTVAAA